MKLDRGTFVRRVRSGETLAGMDLRQDWTTEADPFIMDIGGFDLRDADLSRRHVQEAAGGRRWAVQFTDTTRRARRHVRVCGADLSRARLDRILGSRGDFRGAVLVGASLRSADLREANFDLADVRGADFSGANLEGATFYGANWDDSTRWPDGFQTHEGHGERPRIALPAISRSGYRARKRELARSRSDPSSGIPLEWQPSTPRSFEEVEACREPWRAAREAQGR